MIRNATTDDAPAIARIYNHYIHNAITTFEVQSVSVEEMQKRIIDIGSSLPWLVSIDKGNVIGYAYASKWKSRCAYLFSAESTVYLAPDVAGRGIGSQLYKELLDNLRLRSMHSVIGGIALPNQASIALHEKSGFEKVAHFKEVGRKFNQWIDVGYWELIL